MRQHMDDIKKKAAERAQKMGLTYAGALLPSEAHALMKAGAKLVDVRTQPELLYVAASRGASPSSGRPIPATGLIPSSSASWQR